MTVPLPQRYTDAPSHQCKHCGKTYYRDGESIMAWAARRLCRPGCVPEQTKCCAYCCHEFVRRWGVSRQRWEARRFCTITCGSRWWWTNIGNKSEPPKEGTDA